MKLAVIGTGYVGLVTGTCFAETGNFVTCVDVDAEKVAKMKEHVPIYEPGLERLMLRNIEKGRLNFTTSTAEAVRKPQWFSLQWVRLLGKTETRTCLRLGLPRGDCRRYGRLSGDCREVNGTCWNQRPGSRNYREENQSPVRHSLQPRVPERGAIEDCLKPDRIVVGNATEKAKKLMGQLYSRMFGQRSRSFSWISGALVTKYAANGMLPCGSVYEQFVSTFREGRGGYYSGAARNRKRRIGRQFLFPGLDTVGLASRKTYEHWSGQESNMGAP